MPHPAVTATLATAPASLQLADESNHGKLCETATSISCTWKLLASVVRVDA
jgi:hypothetical protein